jgi:multisubunit Na+/H+ antiporter MnhF subunit
MTTTDTSSVLRTASGWHRPLMALAAAMAALILAGVVGMVTDARVLTGLPIWDKPTKFAISVLIYAVTWAWLIAAVGLADGGPGLPLLGWSTVGGDLRIPHFVGMHALQAIPLVLVALELLAVRVAVLRSPEVRRDLVGVAVAGFAAVLALLTWQALRGQSIVAPDVLTLSVLGLIVAATVAGSVHTLRHAPRLVSA